MNMNIHEYQGKEIFRSMGVAVPEGSVAYTPEEAVDVAKTLDSDVYVVKAQIHAGQGTAWQSARYTSDRS